MKRRWRELSDSNRRLILTAATVEGLLKAVALADLARRPSTRINGSKPLWVTAVVLVNSVGIVPAAYLLRGRRR